MDRISDQGREMWTKRNVYMPNVLALQKGVTVIRMIIIGFLFMIVFPCVLYTEERTNHGNELIEVRSELIGRLSPVEAELLQRIDEIKEKISKRNLWFQPTIILTIVVAVIGWSLAIFQFIGNRKQRVWELLLESLRWFEGNTQKRSIGIALVESKWDFHKEFQSRWASILINQAIYLLTREKKQDAIHERANLYRIMNLLIEKVGPSGQIVEFQRKLLGETIKAYPKLNRGLINLDPERFKEWEKFFCEPV